LVAAISTAVLFVFAGVLLPIWTLFAIYGSQSVQDAPAHGGAILLLSVPIAGLISIPVFIYIAAKVYGRLRFSTQ
jgi:hypothetical protein